ncbi:unnamed protein product [Alopecurus aequalis]
MASKRRKLTKPRRYVAEPDPEPQPVPERRAPLPRLHHFPDRSHPTEDYSDLVDANEIPPYLPKWIYQRMERHLPAALWRAPRVEKLALMQRILAGHGPSQEKFALMESYIQYRQRICSLYKVENFQNWAHREKQEIRDQNAFDVHGSVTTISDIGMKGMLDDLMKQFISPISKVLFPEVGGGCLDSQHSYVVSCSGDDIGLGMHVEDSDITLNVCLRKQFTGGEIYFVGRRCESHYSSGAYEQEIFRYSHVVGQALLYHGRHRHYVFPSIGFGASMIMWCKSSLFKEVKECKIDFPDWCIECLRKNNVSRQNIPIP